MVAPPLAPFAGARQQSSQALQNLQSQLGLIAGGEAGRRAATAAGLRSSADTLLRRVINTPETKPPGTPHVGIDEWATVTRSEKLHQQAEEAEALLNIAIATTDGKTTHWYLASCASPVIVARYRG